MRKIAVVISAMAIIVYSTMFTSFAQDMSPEEQAAAAVDQRKSLFKTIRYNLGPIAGMAQGAPFDAEVAERNARRIAVMATMIPKSASTAVHVSQSVPMKRSPRVKIPM